MIPWNKISITGIVVLGITWLLTLWHYPSLPNEIPIHFGLSGQADRWGDKGMIFFMPFLGSFLTFIILFISQHPQTFNYPVKITEENKERQAVLAQQMTHYLLLVINLLFLSLVSDSIDVALGNIKTLRTLWLYIAIGCLFLIPILYMIIARRRK